MIRIDLPHTPALLRNLAYLGEVDLQALNLGLQRQLQGITETMADYATDVARLQADVAAEGTTIAQI